jgi:hypothetical protein
VFCAGEDVPLSQFTGSVAAGWRLLFTERLERKLQVQFNYGQAGGLVCNKTVEFRCEVQTCNLTEGHAVGLNVEDEEEEEAEFVAIV